VPFTVGEVVYQNAFPLEINGEPRRLSQILRLFQPDRKVPIAAFQASWSEEVAEVSGWVTQTLAFGLSPEGANVLMLGLVGRCPLVGVDLHESLGRLRALRSKCHDMFARAVTDEFLEGVRA
jgi:hypothetical protein